MWKSLNVSIFFVYCQFYCTILILILWTPSTSVIIHTCIHVHQIKLVYIHCSTLCNLVLWWKKNVLACSQAENLILCLCPLQLKWSERQENMRVSLNLFSSIFFTIYFVLVYKSKKSILLDIVSRAELLQACVWYAKCELRNWLRTRTLSQIFRVTTAWKVFLNDTLFLSCTYIPNC